MALDLDAYGSTVVVFTKRQLPVPAAAPAIMPMDLSTGRSVKFATGPGGSGNPVNMNSLADWTTLPGMANYSGVASYEKKVTIPAATANAPVVLSFGDYGGGAAAAGRGGGRFAAAINPPVRDVAVFVNDQRIGGVVPAIPGGCHRVLKAGENTIRIEVWFLATRRSTTWPRRASRITTKERSMQPSRPATASSRRAFLQAYAQPLPSGLTGPIKLEAAPCEPRGRNHLRKQATRADYVARVVAFWAIGENRKGAGGGSGSSKWAGVETQLSSRGSFVVGLGGAAEPPADSPASCVAGGRR